MKRLAQLHGHHIEVNIRPHVVFAAKGTRAVADAVLANVELDLKPQVWFRHIARLGEVQPDRPFVHVVIYSGCRLGEIGGVGVSPPRRGLPPAPLWPTDVNTAVSFALGHPIAHCSLKTSSGTSTGTD
jgi:hypothetical protein